MSKQPEALRLAKELVAVHKGHADEGPSTFSEAADELRRLHEANQTMLEALKKAKQFMEIASDWNLDQVEMNGEMRSTYDWIADMEAAIAKATGGQA